jgi:protein-S-isoprenylcysteine O-methyltransferase Ste14
MNEPPSTSRRALPPRYFLLAVVVLVGLHFLFPIRQIIFAPLRYAGIVAILAALALVLWAARLFDRAGTTIKPFESSSSLVVVGPYRLSRTPMYLGMVIALLGAAVLAGSISPFAVVPLFVGFIDRRFIRAEEAALRETFGPRYAEYQAKVRRWL